MFSRFSFKNTTGKGTNHLLRETRFHAKGQKRHCGPSPKSSMMLLLFLFVPFAKALLLIRSPSGMMRSEVIDRR